MMITELQQRVRALESRVADLEQRAWSTPHAVTADKGSAAPGDATPPATAMPDVLARARARAEPDVSARPAPTIAPEPPATAPPSQPPRLPPREPLERYLGVTVLGRLGAAALFLAAVYFAQLGWHNFGPVAKVAGIYALGGVLLGLGFALRGRVTPGYVALLWGAGVADLYLAGVVAKLVYDVISTPVAFALLVAASAVGQVLAHRSRQQILACVALTGAAIAPLLAGGDRGGLTLLLIYLLAVHSSAAWFEARMRWSVARASALLSTGGVALVSFASHWEPRTSLLLHAHLFHLGLALPELLAVCRRGPISSERRLLVTGSAAALSLGFVQLAWGRVVPAYPLAAGVAWFLAAFSVAPRHAGFGRDLGRLGGVLLAIAALLAWPTLFDHGVFVNEALRAVALATVVGVVLASEARLGVGSLAASVALSFVLLTAPRAGQPWVVLPLGFGAMAIALCAARDLAARRWALAAGVLLAAHAAMLQATQPWPAVHVAPTVASAWLAFAVLASFRRDPAVAKTTGKVLSLVLLGWAGATFLRACAGDETMMRFAWNARVLAAVALLVSAGVAWRARVLAARGLMTLAGAAVAVTYVAGLGEVLSLLQTSPSTWRAAAGSIYTLIFGVALLVAGFHCRVQALRLAALAVLLVVTIKVGLYDLAHLTTPLRVLVTAALGSLQLAAAWAFARVHRPQGTTTAST